MSADIELVRNLDHRAGSDESIEQEIFIAELRADGFSEQDIRFWYNSTLSLQAVLSYAVSKGVEVKVLLRKDFGIKQNMWLSQMDHCG